MPKRLAACLLAVFTATNMCATSALASDVSFYVRQAVVWVHCGNRQGSGVVINSEKGYVLTNAHVLMDVTSATAKPDPCEIGFIKDQSYIPKIFYNTTLDKHVFDEANNKDFAILKIGEPEQGETIHDFPVLKTDEFSKVGDPVSVVSYPHSAGGTQLVTTGAIEALAAGTIRMSAVISPGSSGGAGINGDNNLIGIAMGILIETLKTGEERIIDYVMVDIRNLLTWLDTFGPDVHDQYITHNDFNRYHGPQGFIPPSSLSCALLAKTTLSSTVYCLKKDDTRAVFPNNATYLTWLADFSAVTTVPPESLSGYRLTANVTMKPGTLIKVETDPKVYLVTDAAGAIRWIQTEDRARDLFGDGWAGFVKDVPVEFFTSYHVDQPIP